MLENPLQLLTVCKDQSLLGLRQVKEYVLQTKKQYRNGGQRLPPVELVPMHSLHEALVHASADSDQSIVLACGFRTTEIKTGISEIKPRTHLYVLSNPPDSIEKLHIPTSSLLEYRTITRTRSLAEGVRKIALRLSTQRLGQLRQISQLNELDAYFSLRFRVWNDMGYIPPGKELLQEKWEIDCFDRFSSPIGFFSYENELIACARLVQPFGNENRSQISTILELLNNKNSQDAIDAFSYLGRAEQPFDILCEFKGFREYYHSFVRKGLAAAEVSRVIVDPRYRGYGIAEVLVDSIISLAVANAIDILLLACREKLGQLYERCGFAPVPGLKSDKFITIPETSIVMQRKVKRIP